MNNQEINTGPYMVDKIYGMKVLQNSFLIEDVQFRFPRCKSKRIAKKWKKDKKNYKTIARREAYISGNNMYIHPETYAILKKELEKIYCGQ